MTLFPSPLTSVALLVLWLLLSREVGLGSVLLGAALAIGVPLITARLRPIRPRVRRPLVVLRYVLRVATDVVVSNFQVAAGVVAPGWQKPKAAFVVVPLELRDPTGLAVLSLVTAIVPGTVWSELALDRSAMLLHVWDLEGEAAFAAYFKERYEKPLREIFE